MKGCVVMGCVVKSCVVKSCGEARVSSNQSIFNPSPGID